MRSGKRMGKHGRIKDLSGNMLMRKTIKRRAQKQQGEWFSVITRFTYAVLIAAVFFTLLSPGVCLFLFFIDLIWLTVLLCYGNSKNRHFLASGIIVTAGCAVAFFAVKVFTGHKIRMMTGIECGLLLWGAAEAAIAAIMCRFSFKETLVKQELYKERKDDLKRIQHYIQKYEIVGINAIWGAGKSFIMDCMQQNAEMQEQYEMIRVDLLSCDLDAVELILVEELEKVFQQKRIYPEGSRRLKNLLGKNQWADMLGELVIGHGMGLSASFDSFRQELRKLDKRILIIFEDIDRIFDRDTIQKIFAISEKLSCDRLHVLFQYDIHVLKEKGFERDYLEKYIPYTVNLTPIPFRRLVGYLWEELDMEGIPLEQKDVDMIGQNLPGMYEAGRILGMDDITLSIEIDHGVSIRKVRFFLDELREVLCENSEIYGKKNARTVMCAVFIKHFFDSYYNMLHVGESPLES